MAGFLKDLFSLLKALLTLLFVVFLAISRPGPPVLTSDDTDAPEAHGAGEMSIDRVVTLSIPLHQASTLDEWITEPSFNPLATFSRLALYVTVNGVERPLGIVTANTTQLGPLRVEFDGHVGTWSAEIRPVDTPGPTGPLRRRQIEVQLQFEETSLQVFPLEVQVLLEIELPPRPPWLTSAADRCWDVVAATCRDLAPALPAAARDPVLMPFMSDCTVSVSETIDGDFILCPPLVRVIHQPEGNHVCVTWPTSDPAFLARFEAAASGLNRLTGGIHQESPTHRHFALAPDAGARKDRLSMCAQLTLDLASESEAGVHPPLTRRGSFYPVLTSPPHSLLQP